MQYNQSYKSHTVSRVGFFRIYSLFNYLFDLYTCWQLQTLELFSKRAFRSVLPTHQILELRSSYLQRYSLFKLHGEIWGVAKIGMYTLLIYYTQPFQMVLNSFARSAILTIFFIFLFFNPRPGVSI